MKCRRFIGADYCLAFIINPIKFPQAFNKPQLQWITLEFTALAAFHLSLFAFERFFGVFEEFRLMNEFSC